MALTQIGTDGIKDDAVTLAKKAGIERGKLIIGDASGNPVALAKGSNGQVLKTDGTDISWGALPSSDVVADTTPQLGGNLDTNGAGIVSVSNSDINIVPHGTGNVNLETDTVRVGDTNADATVTTSGTGDLTLSTNSGTNSGTIEIEDGANANINLSPNGTGETVSTSHITLDNDHEVRFAEADGNGSAYVGLKGATDKGSDNSYTLSLPAAAPTAGKVLKANASTPTTLEWGDAGGNTTTGTQNFTVADGNLVIGTEGHGIDFSASSSANNSASVTSELLQDYEEGTFNITINSHQGNPQFTYTNQVGKYCKVGRNVTVHGSVAWNDENGIWGYPRIEGLPCLGSINGSQQVHLSFSNIDGYTAGSDQGSEGQWTWATLWIGPNSGNGTMWRNKWGGQYPLQISGGCQKNQGSMSFTGTYIAYQAN